MPLDAQATHLLDLDEVVLCHIIARLPEPARLAQTCKALLHASRNPLCRQLWFNRNGSECNVNQGRHIAYACLSWRGLTPDLAPQQLVQFLLSAIQASPAARQQHRQQLRQAVSLCKAGQWLQALCLLAPCWQHLLLSAAAAHHSGVLAALLQGYPASREGAGAPAGPACSSAATHDQVATGLVSENLFSSNGDSQWPPDAQQQQQQQQQQAEDKQSPLSSQLPGALRLPTYRHDQLQSAMVSAAAAGQAQSLAFLLRHLATADCRNTSEKLDLLCSVMEAAAAAGSDSCLAVLWDARSAALPASINCGCVIDKPDNWQQLTAEMQQLHVGLGALRGRQLQERLLCSSRYCLVAAASSGNAQLLSGLLQSMPRGSGLLVTQQLPAALQAAGERGNVATLQVLLELQEMSSRPLQLAAMHAALHAWPAKALAVLLQHIAARFRLELLLLLAKPLLLALQAGNAAVAEAMLLVLQREACTEQPEVLRDVLLLLAHQGQSEHVAWVLKVAPTVLVKLGPCAAAAALEGGYPKVAQQILDAGAARPAAFKAAAKRGQLVAAVRARDIAAVRLLLTEVTLPLVWTCEGGSGVSSSGSSAAPAAAPAAAAAAAGAAAGQIVHAAAGGVAGQHLHAAAHLRSSAAGVSSSSVGCLRALLCNAADAGTPCSLQLLRLLLPALPPQQSRERQDVLLQLVQHCLAAGRCAELQVVLSSCCGSARSQGRLLCQLLPNMQLPDDDTYLGRHPAVAPSAAGSAGDSTPSGSNAGAAGTSQCSSCGSRQLDGTATATAAAVPGSVAAALLLLQRPGTPADMLSRLVANPYLGAAHPAEYLGAEVRPSLPAVFMPCRKGLTLLLRRLAAEQRLPPGARVKDVALYKLMVRVVLQACSVDLLGAFLGFMEVHGEGMLGEPRVLQQAEIGVEQVAW